MNIIELCDIKTKNDIVQEYPPALKENNTPLIIDNGSYECRVGWSTCTDPLFSFRNLIAKPRKDRKKDTTDSQVNPPIQIGNNIINIEALRFQLKTQFDRDVITHYHNQEQIFDYIFTHLGIDHEASVPHPILMTEAMGNPNYCRQQMNELLFECYGVPGVTYGIDALHSFQRNGKSGMLDGLIISFGYYTTHVMPLLDGKVVMQRARRLNVGGYHIITYLFRLMQMKYPVHLNAITISRMESLMQQHSSISLAYVEDMKKWSQVDFYEQNVKRIQLPYTVQAPIGTLTPEQKFEKRREMTKRLLEANAKRAKQKLEEDEQQLKLMDSILGLHESGNTNACSIALAEHGIGSTDELNKIIPVLRARIQRLRQKLQQPIDVQSLNMKEKTLVIPQPPLNVPLLEWVTDVKDKRVQILERKHTRKVRRKNLAKRRTAAAQERMRIISLLARKEKGVDDFGIHDEDWDVYKAISRDNDSDSELENEKLIEFEDILRHHDPNFKEPVLLTVGAAENYQLHFGVEAIRAPEVIFQPSMIGSPEAGLAELINFVIKTFPVEQQQRLAANVFLTGGCAKLEGLKERLSRELLEMLPFKMPFNISIAEYPDLDAWLGARDFASSENFSEYLTTRQDYNEKGSEFFRSHKASNYYYPTPDPII